MTYLLETLKRSKEQYIWERVDADSWKLLWHKLKRDKNWKFVEHEHITHKAYRDFPKDGYKLMSERDLFVLFL